MTLYYTGNHRDPGQLEEMHRLERSGICLFCPDNLANEPEQRLLHRTSWWSVTPNRYPYAGTQNHLLLVPTIHVADLLDLPTEARNDFWTALSWVRDTFELEFYGLGARCGPCEYTGGTIEHVHVHVIVGAVTDPEHQPVRFKLSSRPGR
ncbi:HIT domain-containing protein [Actinokineospora sp. NBRC 105648]|uniref:HIT family protein n=1 Tax=Actinokineospora sp. NBRC 105648 TaxID=3032206 RepID=UPI0024A5737D|nr:HIT domain-containing protein [Actinokineospora sp. NBRC 105648]GLZ37518.1 hypothetical protein Acsp05_11430 [Actinokineospora sp. NBRC 105648]